MIQLRKIEQIASGDKLFLNVFGRLGAMLLLAVLFAFVTVGCGDDKEIEELVVVVEAPATQIMPLKLIFKAVIDVSKIEEGDIRVVDGNGNEVAIIYSFSDDRRTLTIITEDTSGWKTGSNYHYYVSLVDASGNAVASDAVFFVPKTGDLLTVRGLQFDEFTCMLEWKRLEDAEGYDLYAKQVDAADYELLASLDYVHKIDVYELLASKNKPFASYYLKVIGRNSGGVGKLSDAPDAYFVYAYVSPPVKVLSFDSETEIITWEKQVQGQTFIQEYHFYVEKVGGEDIYPCRYVGKYTSTDNRPEISVNIIDKNFCPYYDGEYIIKIASATARPSLHAVKDAVATKYVCVVKVPPPVKDLRYDAETKAVSWKKSPTEDKVDYYSAYVETEDRIFSVGREQISPVFLKYQDDRVVFDIEEFINALANNRDHLVHREFFELDKYYVKIVPVSVQKYQDVKGDFYAAGEVLIYDFTFTPPTWWN